MAWDVAGRGCGAANRIRTCDPVITNDVLYQLSYCGGRYGAFSNGLKTPAPDIRHGAAWEEKNFYPPPKRVRKPHPPPARRRVRVIFSPNLSLAWASSLP